MNTTVAVQTAPPELLAEIFSHACTDTGYTGYSLNLVCKTFHEICLDTSLDIQSAAVCGARKMALFLEMLNRRAKTKRNVVSLFLTYRERDEKVDESDSYSSVRGESIHHFIISIVHRLKLDLEVREVAVVKLMTSILETVSSKHLQVLHADYRWIRVPSSSANPVVLPGLIELSLSGQVFAHSLLDMYIARGLQKLCVRGPMLICRNADEGRSESVGDMLARDCPLLTHLRFVPHMQPSDIQLQLVHSFCELTRSLIAIVDLDQVQAESDVVQNCALPTQLRRIIVDSPSERRLSPLFDVDWFLNTFDSTRTALHQAYCAVALEAKTESAIEEEDSLIKKSLRILPLLPEVPMDNKRQYELEKFERMKAEWLETTAGTGPGCWI